MEGLRDRDRAIVDKCEEFYSAYYTWNDYNDSARHIVERLFADQVAMFYVMNEARTTTNKTVRDSLYTIFQTSPIHYDVVRLAAYLNIAGVDSVLRNVIRDYKGKWMFLDIGERRALENDSFCVINPWEAYLALAHMGDSSATDFCTGYVKEMVIRSPYAFLSYGYDLYLIDLAYIRQPEVVPTLEWLWNIKIDDEVDFRYQGVVENILDNYYNGYFPYEGSREVIRKWLEENRHNPDINRLHALRYERYGHYARLLREEAGQGSEEKP